MNRDSYRMSRNQAMLLYACIGFFVGSAVGTISMARSNEKLRVENANLRTRVDIGLDIQRDIATTKVLDAQILVIVRQIRDSRCEEVER